MRPPAPSASALSDDEPHDLRSAETRIVRAREAAHAAMRGARSQLLGGFFACALVACYVVIGEADRIALGWGFAAMGFVGWRGVRTRAAAKRTSAAAEQHAQRVAEAAALQQRAREALCEFEQVALKGVFRMAFKSLFRPRVDDIVRLDPARIEWLEQQTGRRIIVNRNLPNWLVASGADESPGLFRVVSTGKGETLLDEYAAWQAI